jgi:drug/metabolite transporter (DMT)-like permease
MSFYLIPLVGIAAGAAFLGERLGSIQWLGVALVLTSVAAIFRLQVGVPERSTAVVSPAPS